MPKDAGDWKFLYPEVTKVLKGIVADSEDAAVVLFSNQFRIDRDSAKFTGFKIKIDSIVAKLGSQLPIITFFSMCKDKYRKPCTGMWSLLEEVVLKSRNILVDLDQSLFVGDAAGRLDGWRTGKRADWSTVDRKFAHNLGLKFYSPEEYFLGEPVCTKYELGFKPSMLINDARVPIVSALEPLWANFPAMVVFVGPPASGKSFLYKNYFEPKGFSHVNRDVLKSTTRCLSMTRSFLVGNQSVCIDNTNPTRKTRSEYLNLAKSLHIPCHCVYIQTDGELCRHLDSYRSLLTGCEGLPEVAFHAFHSSFEAPAQDEGFEQIIEISFSPKFESDADGLLFYQYLF